ARGAGRVENFFECSFCPKLTGSRKRSSVLSRSAGAMLQAFSSSSCARRRTCDGPTLMSARDCNHFAQPEESVKSGAAFGLMLGGSKLDMESVQSAFQRGCKCAAVGSRAPRDIRARRLGQARAGKMANAMQAKTYVPVTM